MKPTILFISNLARRTGSTVFLLALLRHIDPNQKWDKLLLLRERGELENEFQKLIPTYYLNGNKVVAVGRKGSNQDSTLKDFITRLKPSLIYSNTSGNSHILKRLESHHIPTIMHVHETEAPFLKYNTWNLKGALSYQLYICCSNIARKYLLKHGVPENRIVMSHTSLDFEYIKQLSSANFSVRRELDIPQDAFLVGGIGPMVFHKGADLWLRTAKSILDKEGPIDFYFLWIGSDETNAEGPARKEINEPRLSRKVKIIGHQQNPYPYIKALNLLFLSSRFESLSLSALEAAYCGVPTMYFVAAGGPTEALGANLGIELADMTANAATQILDRISKDRKLLKGKGKLSHQHVRKNFDIKRQAPFLHKKISNIVEKTS